MTASAAAKVTRSWERYLRESAVSREVIDDFVQRPHWATFDPELGYVLHNCLVPWGVDGSRTTETFLPGGARSRFLYADRKPRINTYGDSFTECTQVSDGETWQEYLAGHFGEPIGNFGVGGHGVYQAYRGMLRVEQTADGAEYVILYVWGDDPSRSIMRCRWGVIYPGATPADFDQRLFNGNPWAHTARTDHFRGSVVTWDGIRRDQEILDHLSANSVPLFDMNAVHQREYDQVGGPYNEYLSRYMADGDGHYNPRGNHFFAYALKDRLLELLDPKPLPYQDRGPGTVDFSGYLPGA